VATTVVVPVPPLSAPEAEIVAGLDSSLQPVALEHRRRALAAGFPFTFISGLRSRSQQAALASDPNRETPAAAAGTSKHEVGFAYDIHSSTLTSAQLSGIGAIAESLGLTWGGRFTPRPDANHFEAPDARSTLAAYRYLKITAGFALIAGGVWLGIKEGS
jgi:D-alanyl-D-alanine carboxypeptidase